MTTAGGPSAGSGSRLVADFAEERMRHSHRMQIAAAMQIQGAARKSMRAAQRRKSQRYDAMIDLMRNAGTVGAGPSTEKTPRRLTASSAEFIAASPMLAQRTKAAAASMASASAEPSVPVGAAANGQHVLGVLRSLRTGLENLNAAEVCMDAPIEGRRIQRTLVHARPPPPPLTDCPSARPARTRRP